MKTTIALLKDGESYLHMNGLFIRKIRSVSQGKGGTVIYFDGYNIGECSKAHFVRMCPTIATEEDIQREKEFNERFYPSSK